MMFGMASDLEPPVREPCGQQEGHQHLGNKVHDPDQCSIGQGLLEGRIGEDNLEILERIVQEVDIGPSKTPEIGKPDDCRIEDRV
jgi:hypothetical protein